MNIIFHKLLKIWKKDKKKMTTFITSARHFGKMDTIGRYFHRQKVFFKKKTKFERINWLNVIILSPNDCDIASPLVKTKGKAIASNDNNGRI